MLGVNQKKNLLLLVQAKLLRRKIRLKGDSRPEGAFRRLIEVKNSKAKAMKKI
jgi:hypothetical protein